MVFPFECQQSVITQKSQVMVASTDCPNQKWAGDISYIWTSEGWLYLAVIRDLSSLRVIGWPPLIDTTYRLSRCPATHAKHV